MSMRFPGIAGKVKVFDEEGTIVITGDPEGLRSLGALLMWLGDADLEQWPYLRPGGRAHIHLYPKSDLLEESRKVELTRLDAKGGK